MRKLTILKTLSLILTLTTIVACDDKTELQVKTAEFTVDAKPAYITETISFVAKDSVGGNKYSWDFGDGNTLKGKYNVTHKYEKAGTYLASMTINGIKSTKEMIVQKGRALKK